MNQKEFREKLAVAIKESNTQEIIYFLAFLQGYINGNEENDKFKEMMLTAIEHTEIKTNFEKNKETIISLPNWFESEEK